MRTCLVTGGAGFIGSHLVEGLLARGERVRVLDNFLTGKRENIAPFLDRIELIEGDIRDPEACRRAVEGVDAVLHQAALPSVTRSIENPVLANEINISGTLNMLWAARAAGVGRLVFASSSAVYGDETRLPQQEGREGNVLSPYALGKRANEMYGSLFHRLYGLGTVALRYFNVFGPRQDPLSQYAAAVPLFMTKILSGQSPVVFGDGEQSRDFIYVANIVDANLLALEAPAEALGEAYNIACGNQITVNRLVDEINRLAPRPIAAVFGELRPGEVRHSFADISKAQRRLGYNPSHGFREGLEKTMSWYRAGGLGG